MKNIVRTSAMLALAALVFALPVYAENTLTASGPAMASGQAWAGSTDRLDPAIYDNGVDGTVASASQLDTVYPFDAQTADDFTLATGNGNNYTCTGILFRGTYWNGTAPYPATGTFNVLFYDDDGTGASPVGGPTDPTGSALAVRTASLTGVDSGGGTETQYDYEFEWLGSPITLAPDTIYWVAVQWVGPFPPQWGWNSDGSGAGNNMQGFPLLDIDYWSIPTTPAEMHFSLHGTQNIPVELQSFNVE